MVHGIMMADLDIPQLSNSFGGSSWGQNRPLGRGGGGGGGGHPPSPTLLYEYY